ncbi:hypothetical protein AAW01_07260 [Aurantiacibacter gangjinensis]|uniref:histidine kinase n=2 Tax=Aurantiacibacter gangjinensis TaxID=502682 RepID=A0A0G9MN96_9SPHN|nr:ATP-binding protein [Aurantiacibacter gangjinensis]KLE32160.1 hypothetical protein AAW01_07260 [Aurantiacibacter gangjinensis]
MLRLYPRSLHGQMLLAVALALLVAQVIAGVLILRADRERAEARLVDTLAFQLLAPPAEIERAGRPGRNIRDGRVRARLEQLLQNPDAIAQWRDPLREQRLASLLESRGFAPGNLVVVTRPPPPRAQQAFALPETELAGARWVIAGRQTANGRWSIARTPEPRRGDGPLRAMIFQSLVLYAVLVGGLALLLRRITRPLAQLTRRVENFSGSGTPPAPMEPVGPDDTRRLIAAHNAMEQRIAALLDEKDVMLGAIGHDLKTPLAALRVRIENVENDAERAKMAAGIEDITSSLDDILSLARVGRPSDPLEKTDLSALVASVVAEYEDMGRNVALGETPRIVMDLRSTWLRRALRNLISNALRYGNQARVSLSREGETAIIRIADKGPGIPDDQIAAMLEPFTRGEASRNRATGGAGLGLTLARAIAEQHGGSLHLANRIDEDGRVAGLLAELRLPVGENG